MKFDKYAQRRGFPWGRGKSTRSRIFGKMEGNYFVQTYEGKVVRKYETETVVHKIYGPRHFALDEKGKKIYQLHEIY